ncbi:MAG: Zn-dependent hydrolase [Bacteroidota bacterium]
MLPRLLLYSLLALAIGACQSPSPTPETTAEATPSSPIQAQLDQYVPVQLTSDLSALSAAQKQVLRLLIKAGGIMDELFWLEAYGDKTALLESIEDAATRRFAEINYGPWDRLDNNRPFVDGVGPKPAGANFYPVDLTKAEFEAAEVYGKSSLYTIVRRNSAGRLNVIPYHQQFSEQVTRAAKLLRQAAALAENPALQNYLTLRAQALLDDDYQASDLAWLDMKDNTIEVVIGPIETYEDQLYGYKAAHECYVLLKDQAWSQRLAKYAAFLPKLQEGLPVEAAYKRESPGRDTELNAYDVIYYAGDCNAGSKTIAINLPNDEEVQLQKGTRRLQLKNAMRAKFDKILLPISEVLIAEDQRQHITFDAFFGNTMFHEVAHGLGIKNTINGKGTVRKALREYASALEEGKADILGLYLIKQLHDKGALTGDLKDYYVTFMAGIFRSVRFGAASAHGKANMIRFNFFQERGAFSRDEASGTYRVNFDQLEAATAALSRLILTTQGDGDYEGVARLVAEKGKIGSQLQKDLDRLETASIPVDVVFEQGLATLGL